MRVFVAGATGAIGKRLVPLLVQSGHSVIGMTRSETKVSALRADGAEPVVADALNPNAVVSAVRKAKPDVIVHQLTAIPAEFDLRKLREQFLLTNRLRTEGTDNLIAGARAADVRRFIAQGYAGWTYARVGGSVKTEADPLDPNPPAAMKETLQALEHMESTVLRTDGIEGLVLRYGTFYGPGNAIGEGGIMVREIRRRRIPIIGGGTGVWSFIHIEDAARATLAAVESGPAGIYNIVDDEPARVSEWLPVLARGVSAKPPLTIPGWLGRLAIGKHGLIMMTESRGASNQKAKIVLGWRPMWPTWRDGFREGLSEYGTSTSAPGQEGIASLASHR